ncbi:MAG: nucleotide sugar dehydrogenase [Bacteroidetes bacterium]|nr:nucleotide sugar dehydrogenase [Fibrella sp.]
MTTNALPRIAIIGLGYVGWPLARAFAAEYDVVGYDHNPQRIDELQRGHDRNAGLNAYADEQQPTGANLTLTANAADTAGCQVFVVTVPTPVDAAKQPDLRPLLAATQQIGYYLKRGDVVIYESTVYPGCTEEDCVPVLENISGLRYNDDFYCGYSPERISPSDTVHTLQTIVKVTSGSTPDVAVFVDALYASIIPAGTHKAPSIRVAEAAKSIENAQRDVNISFMNELALLFDRMGLDTTDVLDAAATKWNFLNFRPGLVGGHCIGVDPYYLTHKAERLGYLPEVILSGRRINEQMGVFVAAKLIKLMVKKGRVLAGARVLLLGITYKENCPDIRNSRVVDIYTELTQFGVSVAVYDPWADAGQVAQEHQIQLIGAPVGPYDGIVLAVAHEEFRTLDYDGLRTAETVVYDLKSVLPREWVDSRL